MCIFGVMVPVTGIESLNLRIYESSLQLARARFDVLYRAEERHRIFAHSRPLNLPNLGKDKKRRENGFAKFSDFSILDSSGKELLADERIKEAYLGKKKDS